MNNFKNYNIFDILGPVMIGPSSSHTAGAVRIGKIAQEIAEKDFQGVTFYLHGSFAKTYKGHGTDRALVAGILGMEPDDERIKNSLNLAKEKGIAIKILEKDLGYVHPNTVKLIFHYQDKDDYYLVGSSIGGGNIIISDINGNSVDFSGDYPTILITYTDRKGAISQISSMLSYNDINIATMKVTRQDKVATAVIELDSPIDDSIINQISFLKEILYITGINPLER